MSPRASTVRLDERPAHPLSLSYPTHKQRERERWWPARRSVGQSVGRSVGRSVGQLVGRPASQPASQPAGQSSADRRMDGRVDGRTDRRTAKVHSDPIPSHPIASHHTGPDPRERKGTKGNERERKRTKRTETKRDRREEEAHTAVRPLDSTHFLNPGSRWGGWMGCATQRRLKRHQSPMQPLWEGKTLSSVLPVTFNGCKTGRDAACGGLKRERERERERGRERERRRHCWAAGSVSIGAVGRNHNAHSLSLFSLFFFRSLARSLGFLISSRGAVARMRSCMYVCFFSLSMVGWLVGWLFVCLSVR